MNAELTAEQIAFRDHVREFLSEKFTPEMRARSAREAGIFSGPELASEWHKILYEKGWVAPLWPVEYGGPGWSPVERHIFADECGRVGAPIIAAMGLLLCGPVLMRFGTPEQKEKFLPRMLSGEDYWCQGFSEPHAGSDLASLTTRAERDGHHYIINGTKIWTSHAQFANWIFLLVRTSKEEVKQRGISFILAPMETPGITVRPIIGMSGDHEVNQVFFDEARVPAEYLVGNEGQGWEITKYLLKFERGGGAYAGMACSMLDRIEQTAKATSNGDNGNLFDDRSFATAYARLEIATLAADWTEKRLTFSDQAAEVYSSYDSSLRKIVGAQLGQDISELGMRTLGPYAIAQQPINDRGEDPIGPAHALAPTARFLNQRASTIFGGTAEVQRTIIARSLDLNPVSNRAKGSRRT